MRQMGGKDEQALEKGDHEDGYDDNGYGGKETPCASRNKHQRTERHYIRQDREDNWNGHLLGSFDGRIKAGCPLLYLQEDVLPNYDSVVNQHPERDDKRKEGDHVDGCVEPRKQHDRAENTNRHGRPHPEGQLGCEEHA